MYIFLLQNKYFRHDWKLSEIGLDNLTMCQQFYYYKDWTSLKATCFYVSNPFCVKQYWPYTRYVCFPPEVNPRWLKNKSHQNKRSINCTSMGFSWALNQRSLRNWTGFVLPPREKKISLANDPNDQRDPAQFLVTIYKQSIRLKSPRGGYRFNWSRNAGAIPFYSQLAVSWTKSTRMRHISEEMGI